MPRSVFDKPQQHRPGRGLVGAKRLKAKSMMDLEYPLKFRVRHINSLSGAEKRRRRKGGNPQGGPGQRGGGMRPGTPRSKKGILV